MVIHWFELQMNLRRKPSLADLFVATILSLHLSPHGNKAKVMQGENYMKYDCITMSFMEARILLFKCQLKIHEIVELLCCHTRRYIVINS